MDQAERNLTNLQKCCGLCVLPWQRVRRKPRYISNSTTTYSSEKSSPTTTEPKLRMADEGMPSSGYITRITNDDREEEMDDNLQIVSSYLGNLKNIALDMGDTIGNQNQQIDRIQQKNEAGLERVAAANKRTQDILRRA
jgi:synaptosomal-associated protein 25